MFTNYPLKFIIIQISTEYTDAGELQKCSIELKYTPNIFYGSRAYPVYESNNTDRYWDVETCRISEGL